jgi:hypothetical protein
MKLILPLSSLIHCHIIKSVHMAAYLMSMKPPLRLTSPLLKQIGLQQLIYFEQIIVWLKLNSEYRQHNIVNTCWLVLNLLIMI